MARFLVLLFPVYPYFVDAYPMGVGGLGSPGEEPAVEQALFDRDALVEAFTRVSATHRPRRSHRRIDKNGETE